VLRVDGIDRSGETAVDDVPKDMRADRTGPLARTEYGDRIGREQSV
jgi:hypothetical protein